MKIKHLILSALAVASIAVSCKKDNEQNSDKPSLTLNPAELSFEVAGGTQTVSVEANRDWSIVDGDKNAWVKAEKTSDNQITVTVEANTSFDRSAEFTVRMVGTKKTLTVAQKGSGSQSDAYVYHNDFDKADAEKASSGWPYLDKTDVWKNEEGSGVSTVAYASSSASVRQSGKLSNDADYSDYAGSGRNKIFFGANSNFQIQNITLPGSADFELTFGGNKYGQNEASNVFNHDEFKVYLSNDGKKYVEIEYAFANGDPDGKWSLASSKFTVPSGTTALYIYFACNKASVYSIDDVTLLTSTTAGTAIDFSKGTEIGGGSTPTPEPGEKPSLTRVTIADFLQKEVSSTDWYELTGTITNIANTTYGNFDLKDETGTVYVYGLSKEYLGSGNDKSFSSLELSVGDNITIGTLRSDYNGTPQAGGSAVAAFFVSKNGASNYLTISSATISVSAAATSAKISISSNTDWTVACADTWIKDYTKSGNGTGEVEISFDANTSSSDRTASFEVKSSDSSISPVIVKLTQGKPTAGTLKSDVLTADLFAAASTTYTDFSDVNGSESSAVYAGNSAKNNNSEIQLRSKNNNSGIVTTKSGGVVRKVTIEWGDGTADERVLDVYVSKTAYTAASDLYDSEKAGEKIGSIKKGTSELEIVGDYTFVGLRSNSGAMYIKKIVLSYE